MTDNKKTIIFFEGKPVEVFRAGEYGPKGSYAEADLDEIAATFAAGNNGVVSNLVVDHDAKPIDGTPGPWGIVQKVWRDGKSLFASFASIPPKFLEWAKERPGLRPSVEIYPKAAHKTLTLRNVAVVTDQPAVKGLAALPFSDGHGEYVAIPFVTEDDKSPAVPDKTYETQPEGEALSPGQFSEKEIFEMPEDKLKETAKAETEAKPDAPAVKTFSEADVAQAAAAAAEKARAEEAARFAEDKAKSDARIAALEHADRKSRFDATVQSLKLAGVPPVALKIPGLFEFWEGLESGAAVVTFSEAGKETKTPAGEMLLAIFNSLKGFVPMGETKIPPQGAPHEPANLSERVASRLKAEAAANPAIGKDNAALDAAYQRIFAEENAK